MVQKPVRVDSETLEAITGRYPELEGEADTVIIRLGVKKLILEVNAKKEA
jgi:hypothetical protein